MTRRAGIIAVGLTLLLLVQLPLAGEDLVPGDPLAPSETGGDDEGIDGVTTEDGDGEPDEAAPAAGIARPAVDEEIRRVPAYEETVLYGAETPGGQYLRLAENYLYYSEIGMRSIGHIPLWPRGALYLGRTEVFPYLTGSLTFTNNIHFSDEDEKDSGVIAEVGGGFTGQHKVGAGRGAVSFGLDYRDRFYSNGSGSTTEIMGGVGLTYAFTPRIWASGGIKWERLVDPVGIEYRGDVERNQIYPYVDFGFGDALGAGSKLQIEAGIDYASSEFGDRDYESGDRGEWDLHVKAAYPFFRETTRIYVQYDYLWSGRSSDRLNDLSGGHQFSFGMEGMIPVTRTGRLEGYAEFGYRQDSYDGPSTYRDGSDVLSTDRKSSPGTFVMGAGLRYYAGQRSTVDLRLLRTISHSTRGNYQIIDRGDLWVTRMLVRGLMARVAGYAERSKPSGGPTVGGYDIFRWGVGAGLRWVAADFLDVFVDCEYSSSHTRRLGDDTSQFEATIGVDVYFW